MHKQSWFTQISPIIDGTILTLVADNLVCFYTKNAQKVEIFSQIVSIIQVDTGHNSDFLPDNIVFFFNFYSIIYRAFKIIEQKRQKWFDIMGEISGENHLFFVGIWDL